MQVNIKIDRLQKIFKTVFLVLFKKKARKKYLSIFFAYQNISLQQLLQTLLKILTFLTCSFMKRIRKTKNYSSFETKTKKLLRFLKKP